MKSTRMIQDLEKVRRVRIETYALPTALSPLLLSRGVCREQQVFDKGTAHQLTPAGSKNVGEVALIGGYGARGLKRTDIYFGKIIPQLSPRNKSFMGSRHGRRFQHEVQVISIRLPGCAPQC